MEYVMVPVPTEYEAEVQQYLRWNTMQWPDKWDEDSLERFLAAIDDTTLRLLQCAAAAAVEVIVLTTRDAGAAIGCSEREVLGLVVELNQVARNLGRTPFVMATAAGTDAPAADRSWTLNMPGEVARLFHAKFARTDP